ncbi:MAG: glycosyltransferase family 4 protein [Thermoleophilia bacterium]
MKERPPLLMVGAFLSSSTGIRFVCEDLAAGLRSRGWPIITTSTVQNGGLRAADMLATTWSKRKHYQLAQLDVYSGRAFLWAEAIATSLTILRCPYILTLHDGGLPDFADRHPKRVEWLLQSAAAVTSPSPFLQKRFCPVRSDIQVIRNGLHLDRYASRAISHAGPHLVWVRAFEDCYNPLLALQMLQKLLTKHPDATLLMVGPDRGGLTAEDVSNEAARLGLTEKVRVEGAVPKDRIPEILTQGDIFLNTTDVDNAPVTVVEAMASGLCVVSTDAGGVPDLVDDGREALLVPRRDPDAMAAAVHRVLTEPGLAAQLSLQARTKAEAFAWNKVLTAWERLLMWVHG